MIKKSIPSMSQAALHLPRRLFLVRHGESDANVDPSVYERVPDWKISLTRNGLQQAAACGEALRAKIDRNEKIYFYHSPYKRAKQTLGQIRGAFPTEQIIGEQEDDRLREQEMGNYQRRDVMDDVWKARSEFGRFYFRFSSGENGADVCDRVSLFLDHLFRGRKESSPINSSLSLPGSKAFLEEQKQFDETNIAIVTHGLWIRLFIARYYHIPLEIFDRLQNPNNCDIITLEKNEELGKLIINDESIRTLGVAKYSDYRFDGTDVTAWYEKNVVEFAPKQRSE